MTGAKPLQVHHASTAKSSWLEAALTQPSDTKSARLYRTRKAFEDAGYTSPNHSPAIEKGDLVFFAEEGDGIVQYLDGNIAGVEFATGLLLVPVSELEKR